jgi:hypothetical protein
MGKALLMRYVKMVLESAKDARVPNQLVGNEESESDKKDKKQDVDEFSGVGAIAGFTGPLGMNPDDMGRNKNSPRKRK